MRNHVRITRWQLVTGFDLDGDGVVGPPLVPGPVASIALAPAADSIVDAPPPAVADDSDPTAATDSLENAPSQEETPPPHEEAPPTPAATQMKQVTVPEGMSGGMMLRLGTLQVQIPEGLEAGQVFEMAVPVDSDIPAWGVLQQRELTFAVVRKKKGRYQNTVNEFGMSLVGANADDKGSKLKLKVVELIPNSLAIEAGFESGDYVTSVNGTVIASQKELDKALKTVKQGEAVTFGVVRDEIAKAVAKQATDRSSRLAMLGIYDARMRAAELSTDAEILSGFKKFESALGLSWRLLSGGEATVKQRSGIELFNAKLAEALKQRSEFCQEDWKELGVDDLRLCHYIKSGDFYFEPTKEDKSGVITGIDRLHEAVSALGLLVDPEQLQTLYYSVTSKDTLATSDNTIALTVQIEKSDSTSGAEIELAMDKKTFSKVSQVAKNSIAQKAGLRVGDVLLAVGTVQIGGGVAKTALDDEIKKMKKGDTIVLMVKRAQAEPTLKAVASDVEMPVTAPVGSKAGDQVQIAPPAADMATVTVPDDVQEGGQLTIPKAPVVEAAPSAEATVPVTAAAPAPAAASEEVEAAAPSAAPTAAPAAGPAAADDEAVPATAADGVTGSKSDDVKADDAKAEDEADRDGADGAGGSDGDAQTTAALLVVPAAEFPDSPVTGGTESEVTATGVGGGTDSADNAPKLTSLSQFNSIVCDLRQNDTTTIKIAIPFQQREQYKHRLGVRYFSSLHHKGCLPWIEVVGSHSLARACGLRVGDVVTKINDEAIYDKKKARSSFTWLAASMKTSHSSIFMTVLRTTCRIQPGDQLLAINGMPAIGRDEPTLMMREARGLVLLTLKRGKHVHDTCAHQRSRLNQTRACPTHTRTQSSSCIRVSVSQCVASMSHHAGMAKPRLRTIDMPPSGVVLELHNFDVEAPPDVRSINREYMKANILPGAQGQDEDEDGAKASVLGIPKLPSTDDAQLVADDVEDEKEHAARVIQRAHRGNKDVGEELIFAPLLLPAVGPPAPSPADTVKDLSERLFRGWTPNIFGSACEPAAVAAPTEEIPSAAPAKADDVKKGAHHGARPAFGSQQLAPTVGAPAAETNLLGQLGQLSQRIFHGAPEAPPRVAEAAPAPGEDVEQGIAPAEAGAQPAAAIAPVAPVAPVATQIQTPTPPPSPPAAVLDQEQETVETTPLIGTGNGVLAPAPAPAPAPLSAPAVSVDAIIVDEVKPYNVAAGLPAPAPAVDHPTKVAPLSPEKRTRISRGRSILNKFRRLPKPSAAAHAEVEMRVRHVDRDANKEGEFTERIYRLVMRVDPDNTVRMMNSRFVESDGSVLISRLKWMVSLGKLLLFYVVLCGLMQMPSHRAMVIAIKFLALAPLCAHAANVVSDILVVARQLMLLRSLSKVIGVHSCQQLLRFSRATEAGRVNGAPFLGLSTLAETLVRANRERTEWETWPELVQLGLMHETRRLIGGRCDEDDAKLMQQKIVQALLVKRPSKLSKGKELGPKVRV